MDNVVVTPQEFEPDFVLTKEHYQRYLHKVDVEGKEEEVTIDITDDMKALIQHWLDEPPAEESGSKDTVMETATEEVNKSATENTVSETDETASEIISRWLDDTEEAEDYPEMIPM